jgi:hypothetical protein
MPNARAIWGLWPLRHLIATDKRFARVQFMS